MSPYQLYKVGITDGDAPPNRGAPGRPGDLRPAGRIPQALARPIPLNLVLIGDGLSVAFPLVERCWRFVEPLDLRSAVNSAEAFVLDRNDPELPVSPMWVFGRREDAALEKPRDTISQRNHLRLWLTPLRYEGQSVFVGQISRDIGVELSTAVEKPATGRCRILPPRGSETDRDGARLGTRAPPIAGVCQGGLA